MTSFCSNSLHSLLSSEGRELMNVKFLPGSAPTKEGMCEEAARVIKLALDRGMPHTPPNTNRLKVKL